MQKVNMKKTIQAIKDVREDSELSENHAVYVDKYIKLWDAKQVIEAKPFNMVCKLLAVDRNAVLIIE